MTPLRVAIIGCGKIADQHAEQIRHIPSGRLVAVCDRERRMSEQLAERFEVTDSFDDIDALLVKVQPDVVHLTTPPQSHFDLATKCLKAGCNVYVEKPFSLDSSEARVMVSLAEELGLRITAGHNGQFSPETLRMRDLVRNGDLGGPPVHIESVFCYSLGDASYVKALVADKNHWVRALPGRLAQNVISHGIAKIVEFIDSSEVRVSAAGFTSPALRSLGETDIIDELRVVLTDSRNVTAYFTFTTQIVPAVQEIRLFGPKGSVVVDNLHRTVVKLSQSNSAYKSYLNFLFPPLNLAWQYVGNLQRNMAAFLRADFHMDAGMRNLIEAFYRSIQSGGPPPIPYREILLTAAVMDDIFRQTSPGTAVGAVDTNAACVHVPSVSMR